jgi:uncharacterized beta-barrel protein YwiB (DUF1934 family)
MKKDVIISVKGTVDSGGDNAIELVTEGKYTKKGENYFISYNESDMTGMEGTVTTLEIAKDSVILTREGSVNTSFIFRKGESNVSHYATEFGIFTIGIRARDISINVDDMGGELDINYEMDTFDSRGSRNNFHMTIREAKVNGEYNSKN